MKSKFKYIYLILVLALSFSIYKLKPDTIDSETLDTIEIARENVLEKELWPDYNLEKYPIAVRSGNIEFLYDNSKIIKRSPKLEVFAMTATLEDGRPVIYMGDMEMVRNILSALNSLSEDEVRTQYISTLIHEGLHAKQIESGQVDDIVADFKLGESIDNRLEKDEEYLKLMDIEKNVLADVVEGKKSKADFLSARNKRYAYQYEVLSTSDSIALKEYQEYMEVVEGTARYVELKSYKSDSDILKEIRLKYIGSSKYYSLGLGIAMALDELHPNWKEECGFNFSLMLY